ncbi:MAG: hypothetical protein O3B86_16205 [Planctomycetota bacterium]|nr:hypothetical protein [Planctomycetota bacterium]
MTKPNQESQAEILRTLTVFHKPGSVVEIRILGIPGRGRPHLAAGYFTDFAKAAMLIAGFDSVRSPGGIYFNLNVINPALLARSPDRITEHLADTTSDRDVVRRQWLLIDIDPDRPKGIPSSDGELEAARIVGTAVRGWLRSEFQFFEPIEAMSGNGWHLLFPINTPNDEHATRTVKAVLQAVAATFGGDNTPDGLPTVTVDTAVFNASRITKLYGTVARKGHGIEGRPQRRSELVYVPDYLEPQPLTEGVSCV